MTVTLGQIAAAEKALGRLLAERLPIKTAYWLSKLGDLALAELRRYHIRRDALITEHGQPTNGVASISAQMPGFPAFVEALAELESIEVELAWTPMPSDKLGDIAIAPADLLALKPFLVEPGDTP